MENKNKITKELMSASFVLLILSILALDETYGYALIKKVEELSEGRIRWKDGSLYPILKRLNEKKLIISRWVPNGNRPRKYYKITNLGKKELEKLKEAWIFVDRFLIELSGN